MQLKRPPAQLHLGLMAASCALLSSPVRAQTADDSGQPLQLDTDVLYYKENAGRVQTVEPVVSLKKDFGDLRTLDGTLTLDSLSGATPNGAIPARKPQTFASPSSTSLTPQPGRKTTLYTVAPGDLPQDPHFKEQRLAGDLDWSQPLGLDNTLSYGGHASSEHDFDSVAAHAGLSHDFNEKNTTVSAGVNEEYDRIHAHGGNPLPGSDYELYEKESSQTKTVSGALLGVTQVMTRTWLTGLNYSFDHSRGYLTDPYRILSELDAQGDVSGYLYERRPDMRTRQSLYWFNKLALGSPVLDLSYRRGKDSWGIASDTVEAHLRIDLGRGMYLEPHARWYRQTAADFYELYLSAAGPLPTYMSADPRLAAFAATTFGLKFGVSVGRNGELSLRLEQYQQRPSEQSSPLPLLQGLDLNPDLKATIVQLGWRLVF
ncbi:MAG TPA: DUF3570 domain-containing protein [Steroidobacteraceae bacterium]|jgi:hypothetical protein|nr:DUF3570 domain-containing protein [Steroidobacteraceae bacterium]